jgi:hypothetical protein
MKEPKTLKYGIKSQLAKFTVESQAAIRDKIEERCKISRQTLSSYENAAEDDKLMIPGDYLPIIADILHCRIVDILPKKLQTF